MDGGSGPGPVRTVHPLHAVHIHSLSLFPHDGLSADDVEHALQIQASPPTEVRAG